MSSIPDFLCVDGINWYKGKADAVKLGYKNTAKAIRDHVSTSNKRIFKDIHQDPVGIDWNDLNTIFINEDGRNELIMKSRKAQAVYAAKECGMKVGTKYLCTETEIMSYIQTFLTDLKVPFEFQKAVGKYRVDLYLPHQKLVIEVDERGHQGRDPEYEEAREAKIQRLLKCEFLRVNPDDKKFNIASLLADITRYLIP